MGWKSVEPASNGSLEIHRLNLEEDDFGPHSWPTVDAVLSKVTDEQASSDPSAAKRLRRLEAYISAHPSVVDLEPSERQRQLGDRRALAAMLDQVAQQMRPARVSTPLAVVVEQRPDTLVGLQNAVQGVRYPFLLKPTQACGSASAHELVAVGTPEEFWAALPRLTFPLLVQECVDHDAVIFKVYVLGRHVHVVRRPSLRNLGGYEGPAIFFNSQHKLPSSLVDESAPVHDEVRKPSPDPMLLDSLIRALNSVTGLYLFGLDILIPSGDNNSLIMVDLNYFPGYGGVREFPSWFVEYFHTRLLK